MARARDGGAAGRQTPVAPVEVVQTDGDRGCGVQADDGHREAGGGVRPERAEGDEGCVGGCIQELRRRRGVAQRGAGEGGQVGRETEERARAEETAGRRASNLARGEGAERGGVQAVQRSQERAVGAHGEARPPD